MFDFLSLKTEAFGLNVNDSSIKIVKLAKKRGFFNLTFFRKIPIKPGIVENGEIKNQESLIAAIKGALYSVKREKIGTKYLVASLPEEKSFLQVIQMPLMTDAELKSAVFFEAENYIPMPIDQVYLDFQIISPLKENLNHLDVLIVAMPKTIVDSYVLCFKKAGLVPIALEVESQAVARVLVKNQTSDSPLVLVDIGEDNIGFTVFAGRSVHFTSSILLSLKELKNALRMQTASTAFDQMSEEIEKYLSFYQEHASHEHLPPNAGPAKIVLSGEGADLKGLQNFLSKKLNIAVELGNPKVNIQSKEPWPQFKNSLCFSATLGLALRGIGNND